MYVLFVFLRRAVFNINGKARAVHALHRTAGIVIDLTVLQNKYGAWNVVTRRF